MLERSLEEVRRRTKVIGRFPGESSCLSLCWAVLAGVPTILGTLIGGLAYVPVLAAVLLAVGAAAALQVVFQISALVARPRGGGAGRPATILGFAAGLVLMYTTALVVAL